MRGQVIRERQWELCELDGETFAFRVAWPRMAARKTGPAGPAGYVVTAHRIESRVARYSWPGISVPARPICRCAAVDAAHVGSTKPITWSSHDGAVVTYASPSGIGTGVDIRKASGHGQCKPQMQRRRRSRRSRCRRGQCLISTSLSRGRRGDLRWCRHAAFGQQRYDCATRSEGHRRQPPSANGDPSEYASRELRLTCGHERGAEASQ
jgi:hypothetical protein